MHISTMLVFWPLFLWFGIVWCWRSISCFRLLAFLPYMSIDAGCIIRKQLANRQAFPLNWHTIPASALVTSMVYIPSARAEEAGPEGQCQHGCEYQTMPIFTPRFSFSLGFVFPRNTNGAAAMTAVSSATSSTSR